MLHELNGVNFGRAFHYKGTQRQNGFHVPDRDILAPPAMIMTQQQQQQQHRNTASIRKAFQGTLERDWLEMHQQLGRVMESVSNVRQCLYWEYRALDDGAGHLLPQDVELAFQHDLKQHEALLAGARSLLASLNQAQEALGRRLEEAMRNDTNQIYEMEHIYTCLAAELYRKQSLVMNVLESTHSGLFSNTNEDEHEDNPRQVAQRCCHKWKFPDALEKQLKHFCSIDPTE
jgi:hypothetical protein